jgi:hypothetical protein
MRQMCTTRLRRLERELGTRTCPVCGGKGKYVISHVYDDDPPPPVEGCPQCGETFHIIVRFRNEGLRGCAPKDIHSDVTAEELGRLHSCH